eukprot:7389210-Prymnesium_polylepis.2
MAAGRDNSCTVLCTELRHRQRDRPCLPRDGHMYMSCTCVPGLPAVVIYQLWPVLDPGQSSGPGHPRGCFCKTMPAGHG